MNTLHCLYMYISLLLNYGSTYAGFLTFFQQKVYVALDEPDGVAGVAAVRHSESSLYEEIVEYESTGMYIPCACLSSID